MGHAFFARQVDMWARLQSAREILSALPTAEPGAPAAIDSVTGLLYGVSLIEQRPYLRVFPLLAAVWPKCVAQIVIYNDRGATDGGPELLGSQTDKIFREVGVWRPDLHGYSVQVWRPCRGTKVAFDTGDSLDVENNAAATAVAFLRIIEAISPSLVNGTLSQNFPDHLKGEGPKAFFVRHLIEPYRAPILYSLLIVGFALPVAMVIGKLLTFDLLLPLIGTLCFGAMLLIQWIPGLVSSRDRLGRVERWFVTLPLLGMIFFSWYTYAGFLTTNAADKGSSTSPKGEQGATSLPPDGVGDICGGDFFPKECKGDLVCLPKYSQWKDGIGVPGTCQLPNH